MEAIFTAFSTPSVPESHSMMPVEAAPFFQASSLLDPTDRVVVVAAKVALPEYLRHSVYMCQPNRAFQDCVRLAFYTNNKIHRRIPKILGYVEAISGKEFETRRDLTRLEKEKLLFLHDHLEGERSDDWDRYPRKIIFLSSPESLDTLHLPNDIVNDLISWNGRGTAFTQGQRYVSLSRLEKGPKTTSELI